MRIDWTARLPFCVRQRAVYLLAFLTTILLGLAFIRGPNPLSALFGKYPGDVLWAIMVFFGCGFLRPQASTIRVAGLALAFSLGIECLKLYQAPWMVDIRHSRLGYLVFGHSFSFENIAAYALGIVLAAAIEIAYFAARQARLAKG